MFFTIVFVPMAIVMLIVFFFGLVYWKIVSVPRQKEREVVQFAREAFNAEKARVESLPKLNTQWLMRVPEKFMDKNPTRRSYGTRFNRMLIIDELGNGWVGLVIPEILECIKAGEYVWRNYHIPFRGAGEAYNGKSVTVCGSRIDVYPLWMSEGINPADWDLWIRIEANYNTCSRNWNYHSGFAELISYVDGFHKKRAKFDTLAYFVK